MPPKYNIGDSVSFVKGAIDEDFNTDISGWQGRITDIKQEDDEEKVYYGVALDSITLDNLSHEYILYYIEADLCYELIYLLETDLQPAQARDTEEQAQAILAEIEDDYFWYYMLGTERAERVLAVLDTSRKEGDFASELGAWKAYINKKVKFPLDCTYAFPENLQRKSGSDRVSVMGIIGISTEVGLVVELEDGDIVPLSSCSAVKSKYKEVLEDYAHWVTTLLGEEEGDDEDEDGDAPMDDELAKLVLNMAKKIAEAAESNKDENDNEDGEWEEVK